MTTRHKAVGSFRAEISLNDDKTPFLQRKKPGVWNFSNMISHSFSRFGLLLV